MGRHLPPSGPRSQQKKGYQGSSLVCPHCSADARFVEYRPKRWLTTNGLVRDERAYYHCRHGRTGYFPFDASNGLEADRLSAGLRPLVCLAGVLASFRDGADDLRHRFAGIRLSAATVRTATEAVGQRLADRQQSGAIVCPTPPPPWDFRLEGPRPTVAYRGLDALSVPIPKPGGGQAEGRLLYTAVLYTPDQSHSHYLVDFDLDRRAGQLRQAATRRGLDAADRVIALTDAGNGLEAALRRHFWDDLLCIRDWYHASQHRHAYAGALHARDSPAAAAWARQATGLLYEQGGTALLEYVRRQPVPDEAPVADALRKLLGYFAANAHRTDYPAYRGHGWDIGSGPTEAGCKVVGERLKGSGMRWVKEGAAEVAPLRALYLSGPEVWDAFWALAV